MLILSKASCPAAGALNGEIVPDCPGDWRVELGAGCARAACGCAANDPLTAFLRNLTTGSIPEPAVRGTAGGGRHASVDDAASHRPGQRGFRRMPGAAVAAGGQARRQRARPIEKYALTLTPDLRSWSFSTRSRNSPSALWDYLDVLVTDERIARGREMLAQYAPSSTAVENDLWRRPLHHRRHLGHRDPSSARGRRPAGGALDGDARLHRPPAGLFPRRIFVGAGNPATRRPAAGAADRLLGRRFGPTQFMPTSFKRYRGGFRRRRAPRRGRIPCPT